MDTEKLHAVYTPDLLYKTPCLKTSSATVEHATECVTFLEDLWIVC